MEGLLTYCIRHQENIFLRVQVNGQWVHRSLAEVSFKVAMEHITEWHKQGGLLGRRTESIGFKDKVKWSAVER